MSCDNKISKTTKVIGLLLLIANHAAAAQATPLADAGVVTSRFYWALLLVVLALLAVIYYMHKSKSPIKVKGLVFDRDNHRLELTVENTASEPFSVKGALRLMQPAEDAAQSVAAEGVVPMAAANASINERQLYQLLCEDDMPQFIAPNETRTFVYDIIAPAESISLDNTQDVEVHIAYNEESATPKLISDAAPVAPGTCIPA